MQQWQNDKNDLMRYFTNKIINCHNDIELINMQLQL